MGRCAIHALLLGVIVVISASPAHAAPYTVKATAVAGIQYGQVVSQSVGPLEQLDGVLASAVWETNTQAWAMADFGSLRAAAYGEFNGLTHRCYSQATATVTDTLTVTGAAGTAVDLKFSYKVHGSASSSRPKVEGYGYDASGSGRLQVNSSLGYFDSGFWSYTDYVTYRSWEPDPASDTVTAILHTFVGDTVAVEYSLNVQTFMVPAPTGQTVLASADLGNTATLQIESLTPGASFDAASGTAYVPEPTFGGAILLTAYGLIRRHPRRLVHGA